MSHPFDALKDAPRLLMEARLEPRQTKRFQPTGFADLGPARYKAHRDTGLTEMLLVESPQSVANWLEAMCWEPPQLGRMASATSKLAPELDGMRMPRLISGFIEASDIQDAVSGGVKNDHIDPSGDTALGFGNVPYHRTQFTAKELKVFFNFDLAQLRGYGLGKPAEAFLTAFALYKIERFLRTGIKLRTECDLAVVGDLAVTAPGNFTMPEKATLEKLVKEAISACRDEKLFVMPGITEVVYEEKKKAGKKAAGANEPDEGNDDGSDE